MSDFSQDSTTERILLQLLELLEQDAEQGVERAVADYEALFPGHEAAVAAELEKLAPVSVIGGEATSPGGVALSKEGFGRYRLERELGHGGQGYVWQAVDEDLGRPVALKILARSKRWSPAARLRFRREAEVSARLSHPNLCTVYEAGEHEGVPFIAMQLIEGRSLDREIRDRSGPPREAAQHVALASFFVDAARALHYSHESGLVHRDLKPGNIMRTTGGEAMVVDFGLARDAASQGDGLTQSDDTLGTPAYMAPEQVSGFRSIDRRTDVYGLAAALHEALTGQAPHIANTRQELLRRIVEEPVPGLRSRNPTVAPDLALVLGRALESDPDQRYSTMEAFAEDLGRYCEGRPVHASPIRWYLHAWRWARRHPAVATLTSLVLLVTGVAALLLAVQNHRLQGSNLDLALSKLRLADALDMTKEQYRELVLERARVLGLSDRRRLRLLEEEAAGFFPTHPDLDAPLSDWIQRAEELVSRLPAHRRDLQDLEEVLDGVAVDFDLAWRAELLGELVTAIDGFARADGGLALVRERLTASRAITGATIDGRTELWEACQKRIAKNTRYEGVELAPQLGLIPLGPDPDSSLEEFLCWRTHPSGKEVLVRDAGRIASGKDHGLVFVLLPGGSFSMGARAPAAGEALGPNLDPSAGSGLEGPVTEVELSPFFISKFEMTRGQWIRFARSDPSPLGARGGEKEWHRTRPIDSISWSRSSEVLSQLGLELPTEAQWEYAARAGSRTIWPWGDSSEPLVRYANTADKHAKLNGGPPDWPYDLAINDGHTYAAPVGTFAPNAFGLHEMPGNLFEWCREAYVPYKEPPRPGDGLRSTAEFFPGRVLRGGSFDKAAVYTRSAKRVFSRDGHTSMSIGVRPVRPMVVENG